MTSSQGEELDELGEKVVWSLVSPTQLRISLDLLFLLVQISFSNQVNICSQLLVHTQVHGAQLASLVV